MNKLLRARATRWATALIAAQHSVRNWTHEEAQAHLEAAWLAGARSLDNWHRKQTRLPVASTLVLLDDGQDGEGGLTIPALNSEAGRLKCPDCGTPLEARGSNGLGVYCPNGLCNS